MTHPGEYIKQYVLPEGISVTKAAQILGVGRPALSNLLNGKAALSPEMAKRMEKAFGVSARELMQFQTEYEVTAHEVNRGTLAKAVEYIPPFLMVTASDILSWADTLSSRHQLAVLLRKLIHSTCEEIEFVNFPGNDDSQRKGWDGKVKSRAGNPWVPIGVSCWEFGTNQEIAQKANTDYRVRTESTPEQERKDAVFVFVTPRRWQNKDSWIVEKSAERRWRDVVAFDANDLEQWLELSISAQIWFDSQWGQNFEGVKSLEQCWVEWCADCEPSFQFDLFNEPISNIGTDVLQHLLGDSDEFLRVIADSHQEGLALIAALLLGSDEKSQQLINKLVVFSKPGFLPKLAISSKGFIPVIASSEAEKELAETGFRSKALVVDHQSPISSQPTVSLRPLSMRGFTDALESLGFGPDEIKMLDQESGRSLTVLRRFLAQNEQLKHPDWSNQGRFVSSLTAMALAGVWKSNNEADNILIQELAKLDSAELVRDFKQLLEVEDSPVWSVGEYRGVTSKLDVLYGLTHSLTENVFDRFLVVAEIVLSERDPSLDLPAEQRWAAEIFEKNREFSDALRRSLGESLVLLAIHGRRLFANQVTRPERRIENLVHELLEPLTKEKLLSQSSNLPMYAEAAPETFLGVLRRDLERENPIVDSMMGPSTETFFSRNERVHLLWALELLAWHPKWLSEVVDLLGDLSNREPQDNLSNKPSNSLMMIFRYWMPQTGATVQQRIGVLERLKERNPKVAWKILSDQIQSRRQIGEYAYKPMWRDYAIGLGEPINRDERLEFRSYCVETCINWSGHTLETLIGLTEKMESLNSRHLNRLYEVTTEWNRNATDKDRARLREHIRVSKGLIKLRSRDGKSISNDEVERIDVLQKIAEVIEPIDVVWRHAWLFRKTWVERSYSGTEEDFDHKSHDERIKTQRISAMQEVISKVGFEGVRRLAFSGDAPNVAGRIFIAACTDRTVQFSFLRTVLVDVILNQSIPHQYLVSGIFSAMGPCTAIEFVNRCVAESDVELDVTLLLGLIEFERAVWDSLESFGEDEKNKYWANVTPTWANQDSEDINYAVSQLVHVNRPYAAFEFAHLDWDKVDSKHIHAILLDLKNSTEYAERSSRLQGYYIAQALLVVNQRKAISRSELALIEMLYLDQLTFEDYGIPNLEREIESQPEFFGDLVAWTTRTAKEHDSRTKVTTEQIRLAFTLFDGLTRIPGYSNKGVLDGKALINWIRRVQAHCDLNSCRDRGDYRIGELLSKAPFEENGTWPCRPVCEALEALVNDNMESGFLIGRSNSRGAQIREHGGDQERDLARKYEEWASKYDKEYPRVAAVLRKVVTSLKNEAQIWDEDEAVRERLGY